MTSEQTTGPSEWKRRPEPVAPSRSRRADPAWRVVTEQELRDLWVAGRGLPLMLAFTVLVSVDSYLVASNQALNFLEQRESVSLTLQVTVAVGGLLVLLGAADAVTGERERGTLETLLLTPASRRSLVLGKGLAALSLWFVAFGLTLPYKRLVETSCRDGATEHETLPSNCQATEGHDLFWGLDALSDADGTDGTGKGDNATVPARLEWSGSRDGLLGSGQYVSASLSPGNRLIRL